MSTQRETHQLDLIQTIFGIISKRDLTIEQQIEAILEAGCKLFGEQIGIVSRIEGDSYIVEYVHAPVFDIQKCRFFEPAKTFCSVTIGSEQALNIEDVKK